jgi:hypothetical protein
MDPPTNGQQKQMVRRDLWSYSTTSTTVCRGMEPRGEENDGRQKNWDEPCHIGGAVAIGRGKGLTTFISRISDTLLKVTLKLSSSAMGKLPAARHCVVTAKGMFDGPVVAHGNKYGWRGQGTRPTRAYAGRAARRIKTAIGSRGWINAALTRRYRARRVRSRCGTPPTCAGFARSHAGACILFSSFVGSRQSSWIGDV